MIHATTFTLSLIIAILNVITLPQKTPRCLVNNRGCGQLCLGESAMSQYHNIRCDSTIIGTRFGRWTAIGASVVLKLSTSSASYVVCECQCGMSSLKRLGSLRAGETKGCMNCSPNKTHGMTHSVEFATWGRMLRRCYNTHSRDYKDYGAKGIGVDDCWRYSFEQFFADMGPRPSDKHTIDRIDSGKDYGPENCRWLLGTLQSRNRRCCKPITIGEVTQFAVDWSKISGVPETTILARFRRGWSAQEAVFGKS